MICCAGPAMDRCLQHSSTTPLNSEQSRLPVSNLLSISRLYSRIISNQQPATKHVLQ
jgi:hypothetical protein